MVKALADPLVCILSCGYMSSWWKMSLLRAAAYGRHLGCRSNNTTFHSDTVITLPEMCCTKRVDRVDREEPRAVRSPLSFQMAPGSHVSCFMFQAWAKIAQQTVSNRHRASLFIVPAAIKLAAIHHKSEHVSQTRGTEVWSHEGGLTSGPKLRGITTKWFWTRQGETGKTHQAANKTSVPCAPPQHHIFQESHLYFGFKADIIKGNLAQMDPSLPSPQ